MNPDGFDDVRVLLHGIDPAPLPVLDVDAILRGGELERRRRARSRWYAVAAALLVVAAVGAGLLSIARPQAAGPVSPSPSASAGASSFRPVPQSPDQWLLYAQPDVDAASSVHVVALLSPGFSTATVDTVLGRGTAQGTISFEGVTSRYLAVDGQTYVEPAVLVKLGLATDAQVGSAAWVRLGPPDQSRFRPPSTVSALYDLAYASRMSASYGTPRVVDGVATTAIDTDIEGIEAQGKVRTYYLSTEAPHLPMLITQDGEEIARFTDWNAPVTTPVAPPASEVTTVPRL
jgi:hypothetical protein